MKNGSMTEQLTWCDSSIASICEDGPLVASIELDFIAVRPLDDLVVVVTLYLEVTSWDRPLSVLFSTFDDFSPTKFFFNCCSVFMTRFMASYKQKMNLS